ncbi:hypothetical protein [Pyxidicoccus caerfyrddinensis]|uniref:hypothetical protein n=1 Tax=Pyxidicoccus caerfyrddinensis TaxID=2709663 RepID=UPI0013DD5B8C|nr:hypothetical protein [Pyxidicoccus caerfyrddinensis]
MRLRLFGVALCVLIGAGCGSTRASTINDVAGDYRLSENPKMGLIIVSTRFSTDCKNGENPSANLGFMDSHAMYSGVSEIPLNDPAIEQAFQAPPGHFSVKSLFEGTYRLRHLEVKNGPSLYRETRTTFDVVAGKAVYLGEIHVRLTHCDATPSVTTSVSDQWARDSKLFEQKMKNVRADEVIMRLLAGPAAKQ